MSSHATRAGALRHELGALVGNPLLRMTPGGAGLQAALAALLSWAEEVELRLEAAERTQQRIPRELEHRLRRVLDLGASLGQASEAIPDDKRPGGALPGDIVKRGGKG